LIADDGTTTVGPTLMTDWPYRVYAATELNGQVYALASDHNQGYNDPGTVYLLTGAPEPSTIAVPEPSAIIAFTSLGSMGLLMAWRRRKRAG
jgi:hypothetical protein